MEQLTNHGYKRIKERGHYKGKNAQKSIERIWENGKRINNYLNKPKFVKYLLNVKNNSKDPDREIVVFGNDLYVFTKSGFLVTTFAIPAKVLKERQ